jgi:hypothetical protein
VSEPLTVEDITNPWCPDCRSCRLRIRHWFFGHRTVWWCGDCGDVKLVPFDPRGPGRVPWY